MKTSKSNLVKIADYRRRLAMVLDYSGQLRIRAQVAESYGLDAVAERCRSRLAQMEQDVSRYSKKLTELGAA